MREYPGFWDVDERHGRLSKEVLKRGEFLSIGDLQAAIRRYITEHNNAPKPFVWTKPADAIMAKQNRQPEPFE